jgi:hypothetical protein
MLDQPSNDAGDIALRDHARHQIQGASTNGDILILEAIDNQVFVFSNDARMHFHQFVQTQQTQIFYCQKVKERERQKNKKRKSRNKSKRKSTVLVGILDECFQLVEAEANGRLGLELAGKQRVDTLV